MKDFDPIPPELEEMAKLQDPDAWRSADTPAEAFSLRYRRQHARRQVGWTKEPDHG